MLPLDDSTIARFWSKVDRSGGPDACWPCTAVALDEGRYGKFWVNGKDYGAHRVAWIIAHGPIPPGMFVCHHCDNKSCCNPYRCLFLGTNADNIRDAARKGRLATGDRHYSRVNPERLAHGDRNGSRAHPERLSRGDRHYSRTHPERLARGDRHGAHTHPERTARGERVNTAKLAAADVIAIRAAYATGETKAEIGRRFDVPHATVSDIVLRRTWKHLS